MNTNWSLRLPKEKGRVVRESQEKQISKGNQKTLDLRPHMAQTK